jgi:hypothetical protein
MIPAAVEIVGCVRIAEQAGEPQAEVPRIDRHHDVALVVDHVLERRQRIAPLTQHRVVDQPLLAAEIAAVEGHADVVAGRRLAIDGLALHEQMRARTIGSRHRDLQMQVLHSRVTRPLALRPKAPVVAGPCVGTEAGDIQSPLPRLEFRA